MEGDLVLEADHDDQPRHAEHGVHAELLQRGPRHQLAGAKTRNLSGLIKKGLPLAKEM